MGLTHLKIALQLPEKGFVFVRIKVQATLQLQNYFNDYKADKNKS